MAKLKIRTKKDLKARNLETYQQTTKAALAVQRWYRGYAARKEVNKIRNATIQIQAGARGMLARRQMRLENEQAAKIQCLYRGHLARRQVNEKIQDQTADLAATMVQARMRTMIQRRRLKKTIGCAVQLQAAWRGYYVRRRFREEYDRKAQIIIQSRMFESKKVQWYLERERQVMRGKIAVFREWAHSAGKRRALARQRDTAALAVQRCFRGYLARRERARLHDERLRGKELGKFVELLRSHMSMVIFEEKERHDTVFPVRGGKGRKSTGGGGGEESAGPSPRDAPTSSRSRVGGGRGDAYAAPSRGGGGGGGGWDSGGGGSREGVGRGRARKAGSASSRRGGAGGGGGRQGAGGRDGGGGSGRRSAQGASGRRSVEPLPEIGDRSGGGGSMMRKAELEDALALADLLNLPAGGGGGGGSGGRGSGGPRRGGRGGGTKRSGGSRQGGGRYGAARQAPRSVRAADEW